MKIAIIGPGAIGLLLAGYLHKGGADILLVDNRPERAKRLSDEGFIWSLDEEQVTIKAPAVIEIQPSHGIDLAVICVKAYDTEEAARRLAASGYRGAVLTLQNGAGNVETIAKFLPYAPLLAGVTSEGALLVNERQVRRAGKGITSFGPLESGRPDDEYIDRIASVMRKGGMDVEISSDPRSLVWGKVIINAAVNPLTALLDVPNGSLLEIPPARELMAGIVDEAWRVVRAMRCNPPFADPLARVEEVCRLTAENVSSMRADIIKRRRTEIDYINGAIVREGRARGIPCPVNETITQFVRALEFSRRRDIERAGGR